MIYIYNIAIKLILICIVWICGIYHVHSRFFLKPVYLKRTLFILNGMDEFQLVSTKIGIYHLSKRKDD